MHASIPVIEIHYTQYNKCSYCLNIQRVLYIVSVNKIYKLLYDEVMH